MEIQLTDLENAAFSIFVVLLTRTILAFDLNFYLPLSKVDENMQRAQRRDAVGRERFWFRTRVFGNPAYLPAPLSAFPFPTDLGSEAEELSMHEILNGKGDGTFPGLLPLIKAYLAYRPRTTTPASACNPCAGQPLTEAEHAQLSTFLDIIEHKASGALPTGAAWMRRFVQEHPAYQRDSVVPDAVVYDLMQALRGMADAADGKVRGLNAL
jgi:glutamate--cysteine ligase catalytic subunit